MTSMFTKSATSDFIVGTGCNPDQLKLELEDEITGKTVTVTKAGDVVTIVWNIGLTGPEITTQDGVIAFHDTKVSAEQIYLRGVTGNIQAQLNNRIDGNTVANNFVLAGYAGIGLDAVTPLNNINSTWQDCDFDIELITTPFRATQSLANGTITILDQGIWQITCKVTLTFNESNGGRQIQLRFVNKDTGVGSPTVFNFFVGRNQSGVNLNFTVNAEVPTMFTNDPYGIQVRSENDTFSSVSQIGSIYQINNISNVQTFPP